MSAGAFLAVAPANEHRGAGIVRLRYSAPRTVSRAEPALVGKGICFDTGGINLKTHKGMYQMHEDMQGSAVAVGTLLALTRLAVPLHRLLARADGKRDRPMRFGRRKSCGGEWHHDQVAHSDAEGRMVLADTLVMASREKPDLIIDFAIDRRCVTALTDRYCGAFTNRPNGAPSWSWRAVTAATRMDVSDGRRFDSD